MQTIMLSKNTEMISNSFEKGMYLIRHNAIYTSTYSFLDDIQLEIDHLINEK